MPEFNFATGQNGQKTGQLIRKAPHNFQLILVSSEFFSHSNLLRRNFCPQTALNQLIQFGQLQKNFNQLQIAKFLFK
jgi:hypothetical protein